MEKHLFLENDANHKLVNVLSDKINSQSIPEDMLREYTQFLISFHNLLLQRKKSVKLIKTTVLILGCFFMMSQSELQAQCAAAPANPGCSPSGATALVTADNVAPGQIKTVTSNSNFGALTISGGTLIVCANLTVTSFAFSSGVIIVNAGANLNVSNGGAAIVFGNNSQIYNYGNITFNVSIVTGQNNIIYNVTNSSVFTVAFNQFVLQGPNSYLINNGIFNTAYFITQSTNSPGPVCSGMNSAITCNFMINQYANAFQSPSGPSCIQVTQMFINSQSMTNTSNVRLCYMAASTSISGSPNFGSATVNNACTSCGVILPLTLTSFAGVCSENKALLHWETKDEEGAKHFEVERAFDGLNFTVLGIVPVVKNGTNYHAYDFGSEQEDMGASVSYYRLKQVDFSGEFSYSPIISINCNSSEELNITPSMADNYFTVSSIYPLDQVTVYDAAGRLINSTNYNSDRFHTTVINNTLARGVYLVSIKTTDGKVFTRKVIFI